jgi:hypothetical protein
LGHSVQSELWGLMLDAEEEDEEEEEEDDDDDDDSLNC